MGSEADTPRKPLSPVLARLIEEVRREAEEGEETQPTDYNRAYNRHMGGGSYDRAYNRHNR